MPQIWPMDWLILFVLFTSVFLVYITLLYFNIHYTTPSNTTDWASSTISLNWKW